MCGVKDLSWFPSLAPMIDGTDVVDSDILLGLNQFFGAAFLRPVIGNDHQFRLCEGNED